MEEKYELLANLDIETKTVYEKYFTSKKYNILINEKNLLLAKRDVTKVVKEDEKKIASIIKNMMDKYKNKGMIYIDLTNEFKTILSKIENKSNIKCTDNVITFPIRKVIENSVISKEQQKRMEEELSEIEKIMFFHIIDLTIPQGSVSPSSIQRNFSVPYSSIHKIINAMYELKIISSPVGSKERKYLLTLKEWEERKLFYQALLKIKKDIYDTCLKSYKKDDNPFKKLEADEDPLLPTVIDYIVEKGKIDSHGIEKEFKTGYNREKKILDQLEFRHIISIPDSKGTRNVLISKDIWKEHKDELNKEEPALINISDIEEDKYQKINKEIKTEGYETVENKYKSKLIQLFKEMLEYKNKNYSNDWTFTMWLNHIDTHYHYYHDELQDTLYKVVYQEAYIGSDFNDDDEDSIEISDIDKIMQLEDLYNILIEKNNDYKKHANDYREYILKDKETYADLYNKQKEKLIELFKEMLDDINYNYDKSNNDFDYLKSIIIEEYPFYTDMLIHLDVIIYNSNETYISLLNSMENIYNSLAKNYKNREKLLEEYKIEQEIEWD